VFNFKRHSALVSDIESVRSFSAGTIVVHVLGARNPRSLDEVALDSKNLVGSFSAAASILPHRGALLNRVPQKLATLVVSVCHGKLVEVSVGVRLQLVDQLVQGGLLESDVVSVGGPSCCCGAVTVGCRELGPGRKSGTETTRFRANREQDGLVQLHITSSISSKIDSFLASRRAFVEPELIAAHGAQQLNLRVCPCISISLMD
jgi:hypothetical protein